MSGTLSLRATPALLTRMSMRRGLKASAAWAIREAGPSTVPRSAWMGTALIECLEANSEAMSAVEAAELADVYARMRFAPRAARALVMARPMPFEVSKVQLDLEKVRDIPREAPVTMASL